MRRAFTLVELLVVIAIVALLIGLLLPSLSKARRTARSVACTANARSLQLAQLAYADTYRGYLADVGLPHGGSGDPEVSWLTTLGGFADGVLQLRSPGDASLLWPPEQGGSGATIGGSHRRTSYGMNNWLSRTYGPGVYETEPFDRLVKIERPSATVQFFLLTEQGSFAVSDHCHAENWGTATAPAVASGQLSINKWGGPQRSAEGLSTFSFLDGHAAVLKFGAVYTSPFSNKFDPTRAQ